MQVSTLTHEIAKRDGGWAHQLEGVFSEAFPTHLRTTTPLSSACALYPLTSEWARGRETVAGNIRFTRETEYWLETCSRGGTDS